MSPARRRHGGLSLLLFFSLFRSLLLPPLFLLLLLPPSLLLLSLRVNNLFLTGSFSRRTVVIESRNGSFDFLSLFISNFLINLPTNPDRFPLSPFRSSFFFFSIFRSILLVRPSCFLAHPSLSHAFSFSSSFFPSLFLSTYPEISPSLSRSIVLSHILFFPSHSIFLSPQFSVSFVFFLSL